MPIIKKSAVAAWVLAIALSAMGGEPFPFDKYPVNGLFKGKPAAPKINSEEARKYRTRIRNGAIHGANFAGHYTIISWGCGTSCGVYVIVDARTGNVHWPPEISQGVDLGVAGPEYRLNSTLLVVANCPSPDVYGYKNCDRKFYNWNGSQLMLLKAEPMTGRE
jgi:hypothetical protein